MQLRPQEPLRLEAAYLLAAPLFRVPRGRDERRVRAHRGAAPRGAHRGGVRPGGQLGVQWTCLRHRRKKGWPLAPPAPPVPPPVMYLEYKLLNNILFFSILKANILIEVRHVRTYLSKVAEEL